MKKKETKNSKGVIVMIENKTKKSKIIDSIKFGAGFYIGFTLASAIKNAIVKAVNASK